MGRITAHPHPDMFATPPLADAATRATWVALGDADPDAVEVCWHAVDAAERGETPDACPFSDAHARERWLWMFDVSHAARTERDQRAQFQAIQQGRLPL